jgi:hypothetical protein
MPRSPLTQLSIGFVISAVLLSAGCVNLPAFSPGKEMPPTGPVASAHVKWESKVRFLEDIVHGGRPTPGIAGDLYLFSGNDALVQADGIIQVELFDVSQLPPGQRPDRALECWRLDKDSLKSCLGKDGLGLWKYTLFLPWSTYRADISKVIMVVSYAPAQGAPVYAPTATVDLQGTTNGVAVRQQQVPAGTPLPGLTNRGLPRDAGPAGAMPRLETPPSSSTRISLPADRQSVFSKLVPQ